MAFQQGLSGLNVSSKGLDVVSNNIANASTVGFKSGRAEFADMYAGALNGSGALQVGIGAQLAAVQQQFTQGNITTTNNPLDIAINGNGFFRLQMSPTDLTSYYARNGQFFQSKEGYIVNSTNGGILTGYASADGVTVNTASIVPITLGTGGIPPKQTGWSSVLNPSAGGLQIPVNLDNRDLKATTVTNPDWTQLAPFVWDNTFNTNMYNYSTSASVYDQSGTVHTLTNYYVRRDDAAGNRTWDVYTAIDNKYLITDTAAPPALVFQPNGVLQSPLTPYRVQLDFTTAADRTGGTTDLTGVGFEWFDPAIPVFMDMTESTQFGSPFNTDNIVQDGYGPGSLTRLSISEEGFVQGNYSNGQVKLMGQIVLAEFRNPNGLQSIGDNLWIETFDSGQPTLGIPGAGTRGDLQSNSVEESNTDLTQELVNMIVFQRNYQANAQSIKAQDQILQTLVNLR
ncbi:MAG: flagellar hook protein FlgE [Azovibrio sp.]